MSIALCGAAGAPKGLDVGLSKQEQERRSWLRQRVKDDLLARGEITDLDGLALDTNVIKGEVTTWTYHVKLKTRRGPISYTMDNRDGAPVLRDGQPIEEA
jgi:hypothetical protein